MQRILPTCAVAGCLAGLVLAWSLTGCAAQQSARDQPRTKLPPAPPPVNHAPMLNGRFDSPQAVTRACLECHPQAARDFMTTSHWTWESDTVVSPLTGQPLAIGKKNILNNFCIGVQGNEQHCMECHAGYGWRDASFDFADPENIDCLICHDTSGTYRKQIDGAGLPAPEVDLLAAAKSVGRPSRQNCGACHFSGGGGDAVKHGDLDGSLGWPDEHTDVHMGLHNLLCQDCHRTTAHQIRGRLISLSNRRELDVTCTDCHSLKPHAAERLNAHTAAVSCQACHIPRFALVQPTKLSWDWSQAGQDLPPSDEFTYSKLKGRFTFAGNVVPEYYWFNGAVELYLPGQSVDPAQTVQLNRPQGGIQDRQSKIYPFKVHRGVQVYDAGYNYLLVPRTFGPGGYWTEFDWDQALRLGSQSSGLPYSGRYGFVKSEMYWPIAHMVAPKDQALQCTGCHGPAGRLDWLALGYDGDPAESGGRAAASLLIDGGEGSRP